MIAYIRTLLRPLSPTWRRTMNKRRLEKELRAEGFTARQANKIVCIVFKKGL